MSFIGSSAGGGVGAGSSTPAIQNSLRFRKSASAHMTRTFGTPTSNTTWTFSAWAKIGELSSPRTFMSGLNNAGNTAAIALITANQFSGWYSNGGSISSPASNLYRDVGAFTHYHATLSGTTLTYYVNGTQIWTQDTSGGGGMAQINKAGVNHIGAFLTTAHFFDGVMAQICFVDGQALTPSSFAATDSTSGEWKPKTNAQIRTAVGTGGTRNQWGTNGFLLDFTNTASTTTLGYDHSQSDTDTTGNNWTLNNFSVTSGVTYDAFIDSPNNGSSATQPVGNYATLNPLGNATLTGMTFSAGNLAMTTSSSRQHILATLPFPSTGKFYWECRKGSGSASAPAGYFAAGIAKLNVAITSSPAYPRPYNVWGYTDQGYKIEDGTQTTGYQTMVYENDILGFKFDAGAGTLECLVNNSSQVTITGLTNSYVPYFGTETGITPYVNFGQQPFIYSVPSGYKTLCTSNLGTPAIDKPSAHFFAKTRTGTGASYSVTGIEFQPDLVWAKGRSGATDHALYDSNRGVQLQIESNTTTVESTESTGLTAFNSDGYTAGALAQMNTNAATYIDWMWKGSGTTASDTNGSITSTICVNTTAGISIVKATTQSSGTGTIGHGLGVAPKMILAMPRGVVDDKRVYHTSIGNTGMVILNSTAATATSANYWNNTSPTSTVFTIGAGLAGSYTYVFYCFAEIAGFSKAISWSGNSSSDGTFIYCGFRPRAVFWKRTDGAGDNWQFIDTARDTYNAASARLQPNVSDAETTANGLFDIVSNGLKMRQSNTSWNTGSYIGFAWAESPLQYANAR